MGCSRRPKAEEIRPEQTWDFISLRDFKSTSCLEPFAYGYLWISLGISIAVYGIDTFTAVNLLAFGKFTSFKPPYIPQDVSKWIFAICIILSWVNVGYEHFRAWRVMRRGAVAESYLDSLAVRLQCVRMGENGHGWRRFLVFAELTKSKKGAEYVALFTYFSFQSWLRVIFCSGPRQVCNAFTLYGVYLAKLDPKNPDAATSILNFFKNIGAMAEENYRQAVILSGMLFTLIVWVFAALSLILALLFYILFLWHYIPNSAGGLSGFCEGKINNRLTRIVSAKVNKALEEEERKNRKADQKSLKKGDKPTFGRQATLPTLFDHKGDDKLPDMPMLNRNDTMATLPAYSSRPGTPSSQQPSLPDFELSSLNQSRPFPSRMGTTSSDASYASNAPLIGGASDMGYGRSGSPAPSLYDSDANGFPFPQRTMTGSTNGGQWQAGTQPTNNGPPSRQMTQGSVGSSSREPAYPPGPSRSMTQDSSSFGPPSRQMTQDSYGPSASNYGETGRNSPRPQGPPVDSYGRPLPRGITEQSGRSSPFETGPGGRSTPGPSQMGYNSPAPGSRGPIPRNGPPSPTGSGYNPSMRSASAGLQQNFKPQRQPQYRNLTEPAPNAYPTDDYFGNVRQAPRAGTPQSQRNGYGVQYNNFGEPRNDNSSQRGPPGGYRG